MSTGSTILYIISAIFSLPFVLLIITKILAVLTPGAFRDYARGDQAAGDSLIALQMVGMILYIIGLIAFYFA